MSSDQIEQYLALGRRALDEHFARAYCQRAAAIQGTRGSRGCWQQANERSVEADKGET